MTKFVSEFLSFANASPSPFHAVRECKGRLFAAGYREIFERESWDGELEHGGKYFYTRNQSSIIAFAIGRKFSRGNGFSVVGAHTDSPCLKVKPRSAKTKGIYTQVGVELYGGGLWHTWFDRDLSLAGRVLVHQDDLSIQNRLVRVTKPILKIPTLAIHLDKSVKTDGFKFNTENQLTPILGITSKLNDPIAAGSGPASAEEAKHPPMLLSLLASELKCDAKQIGDFELCLYDTNPGAIWGANNEFISSARLDNLMMSYCSLTALINSTNNASLNDEPLIRVVALFDNEEIGSLSAYGADSNMLLSGLDRLSRTDFPDGLAPSKSVFEEALQKSMLVSADMGHASHPNYWEKHEENHRPKINAGVVLKMNANLRYATTAVTTTILREAAKIKNVPLQEFVVRNDSPCGSTIGPMLSAKLGLRTVDVGNPQWGMHSIRETAGVEDIAYAVDLFQSFFENFAHIDRQVHNSEKL
jgi:aspartyl aminopeptidase